jgi:hypothetical protein
MKKLLVILSIALVAFATPSIADLYDFDGLIVDIEYSAGTGANEAMLVLTFGIDTYAFLYSWDGSATGLDMLQTIDAASTDMTITYGAGNTIDTISYDGNSGGGVVPTSWWTIFLSTDGTSWSFQLDAPPHPDDYNLTDGDFNGYGLQTTINGQGTKPVTPVPEPGTAALLILGGVVAWGRARKRLD